MLILVAAFASMANPLQAAPPAKDPDPIVCKRDETPEVGSHMRPKPVCMKKSEWDLVEKNTQEQLTRLQDRSAFDPGRAEGNRPQ
jgi:hypothetical protein